LSLIDPADKTNDLGRKAFAIKHVIATIQQIHIKLQMHMWDWDYYRKFGSATNVRCLSSHFEHTMAQESSDAAPGVLDPKSNYYRNDTYGDRITPIEIAQLERPLLERALGDAESIYKARRDKLRDWGKSLPRQDADGIEDEETKPTNVIRLSAPRPEDENRRKVAERRRHAMGNIVGAEAIRHPNSQKGPEPKWRNDEGADSKFPGHVTDATTESGKLKIIKPSTLFIRTHDVISEDFRIRPHGTSTSKWIPRA